MRKNCIVCKAPLIEPPLFVCKNMPEASQNLPRRENINKDKPVDLKLFQCSGCGLVQFNCTPVSYYKDSTRAGERCDALIELRQKQYKHLIENYNLQGKKILEVGAGKGGFLKTLKEMSEYHIREYGIENNAEFVKIAREQNGVNVIQGYTDTRDTLIPGSPFDAFTSFAYPARLIDPNTMLSCVHNNLKQDAVGLVMVPSLEHLLKPGGYYDITKDHIAYYSKETLHFLLTKNGFEVLEQGEVSKLYIYAIVKKRSINNIARYWSDIKDLTKQIQNFTCDATKKGKKMAVFCAGHFAFTVLSTSGIGNRISYIIDNAEFKQGCFAPGSHVPIVGIEHYKAEPVETILILGPIYIKEIINEIREKCSSDVRIATMDRNGINTDL